MNLKVFVCYDCRMCKTTIRGEVLLSCPYYKSKKMEEIKGR